MRPRMTLALGLLLTTLNIGCQSSGPPAFDLRGTDWWLVGMAGQPPAPGTQVTLSFGPSGQAQGSGGVNTYNAGYETQKARGGGMLSFGDITSTRMAGEPEHMKQETEYFEMLRKITGYRADTALLELAIGNEPVLRYRKARK